MQAMLEMIEEAQAIEAQRSVAFGNALNDFQAAVERHQWMDSLARDRVNGGRGITGGEARRWCDAATGAAEAAIAAGQNAPTVEAAQVWVETARHWTGVATTFTEHRRRVAEQRAG